MLGPLLVDGASKFDCFVCSLAHGDLQIDKLASFTVHVVNFPLPFEVANQLLV